MRAWKASDAVAIATALTAFVAGCSGTTGAEGTEPPMSMAPAQLETIPAVGSATEPVHSPMLRDGYAAQLSAGDDQLMVEKYFDFVGDVMRVRVRYLDLPEGTIDQSTYQTCEVELEVPIVWTASGFVVAQTITGFSQHGDFERREIEPSKDGGRRADTDKDLKSCWLTLLEGEYRVFEISSATGKGGRPKTCELSDPGGAGYHLVAMPTPSESDFVEVVDDHFWRTKHPHP